MVLPVSRWVGFVQRLLTWAVFILGLALGFVGWFVGLFGFFFFPLQVKCRAWQCPKGEDRCAKGC